jgi:hypothetical protein
LRTELQNTQKPLPKEIGKTFFEEKR